MMVWQNYLTIEDLHGNDGDTGQELTGRNRTYSFTSNLIEIIMMIMMMMALRTMILI
jgi:hypothetical protein